MTRYSEVSYTYSGGSKVFTIPFSYLKTEHINVFIDDVEATDFEFNTTSQIQINDEITSGQVVKIVRTTPIDSRMVNFNDRSVLNAQQQNLDSNQLFNVVQEVYDRNDNFTEDIQIQVDTANTNASAAVSTANTANSKADTAVSTANAAETKADNAVSTANSTISIANIASTNSTNAVNTANSASAAATAASNKVDEFGQSIETVVEAASKINQLEQSVTTATTAAQTATNKANETQEVLSNAVTEMDSKLNIANIAVENAMQQANIATQKAQEIIDINPANTNLSNLTEAGEKHFLNKSQITNCILEAPNGVATYSGNTITLKAGLKVLMPDGLNADGTLKNIEYTLENDVNVVRGQLKTQIAIFLKSEGVPNDANFYFVVNDYSEITTNLCLYYVINENNIYYRNSQGSISKNICAYIGDATTDGTTITSNIVNLTTQHTINLATKADVDLNNLSSTGAEKFDGEWIGIPQEERVLIAKNLKPSATTKFEFDVSNTIPNDDYCYDIIVNGQVLTGSTSGNAISLYVGSTIAPQGLNLAFAQTRASATIGGYGNGVLPISTDRKLYVLTTSNTNGIIQSLWISAYRRLGKTN